MKQYYYQADGGGIRMPYATAHLSFKPEFLIVDLFCGAGGTTTGFERAEINGRKIAKVIACVNHDPIALQSHWKNHPEVIHFEEDIRTLELGSLSSLVEAYRVLYPKAKVILWASLECTNFSKAKGGQPRDADSRTLADHLDRYVVALNPDYIQIENVVEFRSWGPLRIAAKKLHKANPKKGIYANTELKMSFVGGQWKYLWIPESKKNGKDFIRWCNHIKSFGYKQDWRELNSADFGAYTSRNRLFGCFAKNDLPIAWPEATHAKIALPGGLFDKPLKKWLPVKDVLDFEDEGKSIFSRKKPLSDKTLHRIYAGLIKYVAGGKAAFMLKYNSMSSNGSYSAPSTDEPCPVITTQNRLGVCFITQRNGGNPESKVFSVDRPARTLTATGGNQEVVNAAFIAKYYGNGENVASVHEPAGTLTTKDRLTKVQPIWIDREFKTGGNSSLEEPVGSILTVPKTNIVKVKPFILKTGFNNIGSDIENPSPVIDASRHHHYIINPSHGGHSTSVESPCPVIIARQDKAPLYLTNVDHSYSNPISLENFLDENDIKFLNALCELESEANKEKEQLCSMSVRLKIIEFMGMYGIADIKMRMLKIDELKVIQGFGSDYILEGNQTNQKKFIGNSVHPLVPKHWIETKSRRLRELELCQ